MTPQKHKFDRKKNIPMPDTGSLPKPSEMPVNLNLGFFQLQEL
jgi:hypothetical protein